MNVRDAAANSPNIQSDDLLLLREVVLHGTYLHVADNLGIAHSTVARRIKALEKSLGYRVLDRTPGGWNLTPQAKPALEAAEKIHAALASFNNEPQQVRGVVRLSATEGFTAHVVIPAVTTLQHTHPHIAVELITTTRQAADYRPGIDFEIMVGKPNLQRAHVEKLAEYHLGLYAATTYLARHTTPRHTADLEGKPLVYFVDTMLQVDALGASNKVLSRMNPTLTSTSVYMHIAATRAGAGFGYLPSFMAAQHSDLQQVLPDVITEVLPYWLVARPEALRQPAVLAVVGAIREHVTQVSLMGPYRT